jgi:glycosyltransferase involved in cell wall biosynthesis
MNISVVILTKNEEKNIERCLNSISFCDEIIIVDDFSTDNTDNQISKIKNQNDKLNIKIIKKHLIDDFSVQRNFGMSKAKNDWVLFVDADEEVTQELKNEIIGLDSRLRGNDNNTNAYYLKRRDYFWKHELKFGEVKKVREQGIIRLVKKNSGKWTGKVHEEFNLLSLRVGKLNGFINHYPHQTLKEFINDINNYSTIRAEELLNRKTKTDALEIIFFPFVKFIYNYFFNFGFFDGPAGFVYAFMMSFHSFLVRAKLYQLVNSKIVFRK